jgi:hypothetical protein
MGMIVTSETVVDVRRIALEDAAAVAELSVQLGYEASLAEIEERIKMVLSNTENQVALVACMDGIR